MTQAASAGPVPTSLARRGLLWMVSFTLLWVLLIVWQPMIPSSGAPTTFHQLTAHALIALGLWLGLETTALAPAQRRMTWLAVMIPYTLWFAVAWSAAIDGVFRTGAAPPPVPLLPLAIFLPVIIGAPVLLLSERVGQALDGIPTSWPVAIQIYRVFGSWMLAAWMHGTVPGLLALPAGAGDMLTGMFAAPTAIALAAGTARSRRAAIVWNLFGLADFAVAITMGMITAPGRFHVIAAGVTNGGVGAYPGVLTPAFVVPSSILLHAVSLRQLRRRGGG